MWAKRIAIVLTDVGYALQKTLRSGLSFSDYYVRTAWVLDAGGGHLTLGRKALTRNSVFSFGEQFDPACHAHRGRHVFSELLGFGLRPQHRVVDYGCGSLRVGCQLIPYLERGCYFGLDVSNRFTAMRWDF